MCLEVADEIDRILPAFSVFRELLNENGRALRTLANLQNQRAQAEAARGINRLGVDSLGNERRLGDLAEIGNNFIGLRRAIESQGTVVRGTTTEDLLAAFDSLTEEQQEAVRATVSNNEAISQFGPLFTEQSQELRDSLDRLTTAIENQLAALG